VWLVGGIYAPLIPKGRDRVVEPSSRERKAKNTMLKSTTASMFEVTNPGTIAMSEHPFD
jgi:hypothetical protein